MALGSLRGVKNVQEIAAIRQLHSTQLRVRLVSRARPYALSFEPDRIMGHVKRAQHQQEASPAKASAILAEKACNYVPKSGSPIVHAMHILPHKRCSDITYISVKNGFLYLMVIIDWATRKVLTIARQCMFTCMRGVAAFQYVGCQLLR